LTDERFEIRQARSPELLLIRGKKLRDLLRRERNR